jgi:hypothetical protein
MNSFETAVLSLDDQHEAIIVMNRVLNNPTMITTEVGRTIILARSKLLEPENHKRRGLKPVLLMVEYLEISRFDHKFVVLPRQHKYLDA